MATELVDPMASVRAYLAAEKSSSTRRAYASDWADFAAWCGRVGAAELPAGPIDVARYLAQLADEGRKVATIERRVAAIRSIHTAAGLEPPTGAEGVKAVMRGIRRAKGGAQTRKAPATAEVLSKALERLTDSLTDLRDRALLVVGFAGALRRSELVALQVSDLQMHRKGMLLRIRRSKTDQDGAGVQLPIPRGGHLKPVAALEAWLAAAGITEGPLFREIDRHGHVGAAALSDRSVARIVKKVMGAAGFDAALYSGHSMRAGFVTSSLEHGADVFKIMRQTRHAKVDTVKAYDRREQDFDDHAGGEFL
ncbi:tyrosine-type recombinase/integrase [Rubrivivax sp. JA1024]|nr:tyrosine-type recombinase/integrase [Rubrivivax sp. JA1024]